MHSKYNGQWWPGDTKRQLTLDCYSYPSMSQFQHQKWQICTPVWTYAEYSIKHAGHVIFILVITNMGRIIPIYNLYFYITNYKKHKQCLYFRGKHLILCNTGPIMVPVGGKVWSVSNTVNYDNSAHNRTSRTSMVEQVTHFCQSAIIKR